MSEGAAGGRTGACRAHIGRRSAVKTKALAGRRFCKSVFPSRASLTQLRPPPCADAAPPSVRWDDTRAKWSFGGSRQLFFCETQEGCAAQRTKCALRNRRRRRRHSHMSGHGLPCYVRRRRRLRVARVPPPPAETTTSRTGVATLYQADQEADDAPWKVSSTWRLEGGWENLPTCVPFR